MKKFFQHALANWKTSSTGVAMIFGGTVHLIYQVRAGTANENTWTIWFGALLAGIGLLFAGDAGKSVQKDDVKADPGTGFLKQTDVPPKP